MLAHCKTTTDKRLKRLLLLPLTSAYIQYKIAPNVSTLSKQFFSSYRKFQLLYIVDEFIQSKIVETVVSMCLHYY